MVCDLPRALCALALALLAGCAAPAEVHHVYTTEIVYRDAKPQNRAKGFGPAQGAPAAGGGGEGMQNPATADLDMDGFDVVGVDALTMTGNLDVGGSDVQNIGSVSGSAESSLTLRGEDAGAAAAGKSAVLRGGYGNDGNSNPAQITVEGGGTGTDRGTILISGAVRGQSANVVAITAGVGSPTALAASQSGSLVTNTGTTVKAACTLPASSGLAVGTFFDFLCDDADGLRVVANTSQTITLGDLGASASAGYVETVRQDSAFRLTYTATNVWRGTRIEGTWRKDSTSAGYAYTPTPWSTPASFTPGGWVAGYESALGSYRHVGDTVEMRWSLILTGTPTSAALTLPLLGGVSVATSRLPNGGDGDRPPLGTGTVVDANLGQILPIQVSYVHETTNIRLFVAAGTSQVTEAAPVSFADDDRVSAFASVPVD